MRKRSRSTRHAGLAILAGALSFIGDAAAAVAFSENFEGATNIFVAPTYNYASNYTQPNGLTPVGAAKYMHGGPGTPGAASTNIFVATGDPYTLITGGIVAAQIDAGQVLYNFYAQFSTYHDQNDFTAFEILYLNGANAAIGNSIRIGSAALVAGLAGGAGNRSWASDQKTGMVPAGARSVSLVAFATKTAGGTNIDGYADNLSLDLTIVPEPTSGLTAILAGSVLTVRRRRREPS
jgi:hypothetical protein